MKNNQHKAALVLLVATAMLWSTGGLLVKLIEWNPMAIAGMRCAIAALTIFLVACRRPRFTWSAVQVGGAFAYAGTVTFYVIATKLTTAANAVLLQYTAPIYIAILGYRFVKERTTRSDALFVTITMSGMILFFAGELTAVTIWGNIFGILSGVLFGLFILCMRKQKDDSPLETVLLGNIVAAIVCLPFMFNSAPRLSDWGALAMLGILQLGLPYILYSRAVKYVTALEAVLIPTIEPLFNPVWVFIIIREVPDLYAILGGAVVLFSVTAYSAIKASSARTTAHRRASGT